MAALGLLWMLVPNPSEWFATTPKRTLPSDTELLALAPSFTGLSIPRPSPREKALAEFGKKLFYDPRFSATGELSCANCHQPAQYFTDARPLALGRKELTRHTPSLVNVFAQHWFFWDGRAASLEAQATGPLEAVDEHGIDRSQAVRMILKNHRASYEQLFGAFPKDLETWFLAHPDLNARPKEPPLELPLSLAHYTLATIDSTLLQSRIIQRAANLGLAPQRYLAKTLYPGRTGTEAAESTYQTLDPPLRDALERVFRHMRSALAAYERGLVALDAPFDRFVQRLEALADLPAEQQIQKAFREDFTATDWEGFRLFVGSSCHLCHNGPLFSDQQFHNIGLAQQDNELDMGRALGILRAHEDSAACQELAPSEALPESCRELKFLKIENNEMVGAFKTPSLRNVSVTAPYMHDGRFADLKAVLKHYNELRENPAVGHREESLQPLGWKDEQLQTLEKFLQSLKAPLQDLTL